LCFGVGTYLDSRLSTITTRLFNNNTRPSTEYLHKQYIINSNPLAYSRPLFRTYKRQNETKLRAMGEFEDKHWKNQYEKLVEFKRKNGHCRVPQRHKEDLALGTWVNTLRQAQSNHTIRPGRKELLDQLGFAWSVKQTWQGQYEKLVEFKRKNGDCLVPQKYEQDMSLGKWVNMQRHLHVTNTLRMDRNELLEEVGFVWRVLKRPRKCPAESGQIAARTKPIGGAIGSGSSVEKDDGGIDEEDSKPLEETEPGRGHVRNRFECTSPNVKRPRKCLAESEQMTARTNPRDGASGSGSSVEKDDGGRDEEDSEPLEETEPGRGHVRNRFACPSPNVKRPRTRLARSKQMAARTKPIGGASGSGSYVEKDEGGRDEEDSTPFLVNTSRDLDLDFHSETTSTSIVGLPKKTLEEAEPAGQSHVINRVACPSPKPKVKRPITRHTKSAQISTRTTPRDSAIGTTDVSCR
jgi:hypothetical protein